MWSGKDNRERGDGESNGYQFPTLYKYTIREKMLHHSHYLKYDTSRNLMYEYCREASCRYRNDESDRRPVWDGQLRTTSIDESKHWDLYSKTKYKVDKENNYPNNQDKGEKKFVKSQQQSQSRPLDYVFKPNLYNRIDEYFIENEKADAMKRLKLYQNARAKAEILRNFQDLYESHCRLIEAQNVLVHENMEMARVKQMILATNEKARWMESHAQMFTSRQLKLSSRAQALRQHKRAEAQVLRQHNTKLHTANPFRQYVGVAL